MIEYQLELELIVPEFVDILIRSTLAERRPIDDFGRIGRMLSGADIIITARQDGQLVGVSRALTDFSFRTFLAELAVDVKFQRQGIGKELIRRTHLAAGLGTNLILLAAPGAIDYFPHIGLEAHGSCWYIPRRD